MSFPVTQAATELGIAVGDYNAGVTSNFSEITKYTLEYITAVKDAVTNKRIELKELPDYFALVGQSWAAIEKREPKEQKGGVSSTT